MKKIIAGLFGVLLASSAVAITGGVENVPYVRLLANPQNYNGKSISVSGFLKIDNNNCLCLYLDQESADANVYENAFALLLDDNYVASFKIKEKQFLNQRVLVFGVLDTNPPQPKLYSGLIREVDGIRTYPLIKPLPHTQK